MYKVHSEEVEYSYDCEHCKLRKFMKLFGTPISQENCFVDCTKEIQADVNTLFGYYLENMFTNNQGALLFVGNTKEAQERKLKS